MNTIILRTHIQSTEERELLEPILSQHPEVIRWNIDLDDCDKVLKIVGHESLSEADIIEMLSHEGVLIESMSD